MREQLSGRVSPCQGEGREFEPRFPLHLINIPVAILGFFVIMINKIRYSLLFLLK